MRVRIAISCMSNNGRTREFPNKKFAMMVPAKQVRTLDTQQDIGCVYANDNEPAIYNIITDTEHVSFYLQLSFLQGRMRID